MITVIRQRVISKVCWLLLLCFPVTSLATTGVSTGMNHDQIQADSLQMVGNLDSNCPHANASSNNDSGRHSSVDSPEAKNAGTNLHDSTVCNQCVLCGTLLFNSAPAVSFVTYSLLAYPPRVEARKTSPPSLIERPPRA